MVFIIALIYRIMLGKIRSEFDLVIVLYRLEDTAKVLAFERLLALNINARRTVLIANHKAVIPLLRIRRDPKYVIIDGSNRDAEWSAYQQGIAEACSTGIAPGGLILMNDTVTTHRSFTILRYLKLLHFLKYNQNTMQMAGFCDGDSHSNFQIFGNKFGPWVSSYLFHLSPDLLHAMNMNIMLHQDLIDEWFKNCDISAFFPTFINDPFRKHLQSWLFEGGWYGSQALSNANLEKFKIKLKCILYESTLSAEVIRIGYIYNMMPNNTFSRYVNDRIENFYKRKLPYFVKLTLARLLFVG